jgi:hypothetical protein
MKQGIRRALNSLTGYGDDWKLTLNKRKTKSGFLEKVAT